MKLLQTLWQLPQYILGVILIRLLDAEYRCTLKNNVKLYSFQHIFISGCGLGRHILLEEKYLKSPGASTTIKHEYGHCNQSLLLGWIYLIIIGLPSTCLNLIARKNKWVYSHYYDFYTESWANKWGGVT